MSASPSPRLFGTTNELAKERNRAAAERTLNAWVGNCLALISLGIAFDQITHSLQRQFPNADPEQAEHVSQLIGMGFVGAALLLLFIALLQHRLQIKAIEREDYVLSSINTLNRVVVGAILLIGFCGFFATLFIV